MRTGRVSTDQTVLSTLDARIGEIYWALYRFEAGLATPLSKPSVCTPDSLVVESVEELQAIGSGCRLLGECPRELRERVRGEHPELLPTARDLIPLALAPFARGEVQSAAEIRPVYVRDEVSWKKLSEQGKRH